MNEIPNFNFKTENKNIIFTAKNATLHKDDETCEINNIKLTVTNVILIEFTSNCPITDHSYKITFKDIRCSDSGRIPRTYHTGRRIPDSGRDLFRRSSG